MMDQEEDSIQSPDETSQYTQDPMPRAPQQVVETAAPDMGNLEKIRSILFGAQMQDYNRRFARLEERLLQEASALRDEFRRRHDTLETYIRKELETLYERLRGEQNERGDAAKRLSRELQECSETFENKTTQLAEHMASGQRQLHQQLLEQSKSLSDDLRQKYVDISSLLERHIQEVRAEKTDRTALAALFTEMAMRLNDAWQLPGPDGEHVT